MPEMSRPELDDLVTIDNRGLRIHATVSMFDETCERYAHSRLASLQDQLLLARHCHDADPSVVAQLGTDAEWLRECLDAASRHVDVFIEARPSGLARSSQRVVAVSAERTSATVMSVLRALLDSESVVRSGHAASELRVADGSPTTARRVETVLTAIDGAVSEHRAVVAWLQNEHGGTAIRAADRLHRRASAVATIDTLTMRTEARQHVA